VRGLLVAIVDALVIDSPLVAVAARVDARIEVKRVSGCRWRGEGHNRRLAKCAYSALVASDGPAS
jgi:hypothetical protein